MKIVLLTKHEGLHTFISSFVESFEILPYVDSLESFKEYMDSGQVDIAVIPGETPAVWAEQARQLLVLANIPVVTYGGTRSGLNIGLAEAAKKKYAEPKREENLFSGLSDGVVEEPQVNKPTVTFSGFSKSDDSDFSPEDQSDSKVASLKGGVVVAVAGVGRRVGTTYTAIRISAFLASKGFSVACLERVDESYNNPVFAELNSGKSTKLEGGFKYRGVDCFPTAGDDVYMKVLSRKYNYVILDVGCIIGESASKLPSGSADYIRANHQILSIGSSEWDFKNFLNTLDRLFSLGWESDWNLMVNLTDQERFKEIVETFTKSERERLKLNFFPHPVKGNPFMLTEEINNSLQSLMSPVLLEEPKKSLLSWFKK